MTRIPLSEKIKAIEGTPTVEEVLALIREDYEEYMTPITERSVEENPSETEKILRCVEWMLDGTYKSTEHKKLDILNYLKRTLQAERQKREEVVEMLEELELSCVDDRLLGKSDEYLQGYNTSTERWREKRDDILQALTHPNNPKV